MIHLPENKILRPRNKIINPFSDLQIPYARHFMADVVKRAAAGATFSPLSVTFDGTNDWLNRGAGLTGAADGKLGIVSYWIRMGASTDGTTYRIMQGTGSAPDVARLSTNKININLGGGDKWDVLSTTSVTEAGGWFHVISTWNLATPVAHYFQDGSEDANVQVGPTDNTMDYTRAEWIIGANISAGAKWKGEIAEFYFNIAEYLDISSAANLEKFIKNGLPVNLGADGSTPTGTAPIIYLSVREGDAASAFATNRGSGGGFTENGTLVISTAPAI